MQLRAVALEAAFEGDITFVCHLVRESGINLDEGNIEVGCTSLAKILDDLFHFSYNMQFARTALIWASSYGHVMIVEILIECNASCHIQDKVSSFMVLTRKFFFF